MPAAVLQRNAERFADSNAFLHAVLGAISAAGALDRLLERAAPGEPESSTQSERHARQREQVLSALLGLIAIDGTLRACIAQSVAAAQTPAATGDATSAPALRALLK